jgi:UDP-N-acetylmuramyl pentapeptide synthase
LLAGDDVLLVKASNSVRLGDVVAHLRDQTNLGREISS